jgi:hypothetical protein
LQFLGTFDYFAKALIRQRKAGVRCRFRSWYARLQRQLTAPALDRTGSTLELPYEPLFVLAMGRLTPVSRYVRVCLCHEARSPAAGTDATGVPVARIAADGGKHVELGVLVDARVTRCKSHVM